MTNYKKLEAWKQSMELVKQIYLVTRTFPKEELYGLTSQIKRAGVSVPSNIAERIGRNYKKDTLQFLHISRGSLNELDTQLTLAVMVNIVSEKILLPLFEKIEECKKILNGLIKYYETADLR